ncbi:hypothetical protein [Bradyrhizobium sp. ORS 86]
MKSTIPLVAGVLTGVAAGSRQSDAEHRVLIMYPSDNKVADVVAK